MDCIHLNEAEEKKATVSEFATYRGLLYTEIGTMNQFLSIRRRLHSDLGSCNYIGINLRPPDRGDAGAIWIKENLLLFRGYTE